MVSPHSIIDGHQNAFVMPTSAATWKQYLRRCFKHSKKPPKALVDNLAHRLQLLEIEAAIILADLEATERGRSLVHETVGRFKSHQFAVGAHSILEGMGSHFYRSSISMRTGREMDYSTKVRAPIWRTALVREFAHALEQGYEISLPRPVRKNITGQLEDLTDIRDALHQDRISPLDEIDFHKFEYARAFRPAFTVLATILRGLDPSLPEGTPFNENWPPEDRG